MTCLPTHTHQSRYPITVRQTCHFVQVQRLELAHTPERQHPVGVFAFSAHRWCLLLCLCCGLFACSREVANCQTGLCPVGYACNPGSGQCEVLPAATPANSGLLGRIAPVRLAGGQVGVAAFSSERKSLLWLTEIDGGWQPTYLAGPAAGAQEAPSGQNVAATVDSDGLAHVAWRRAGDGTLWYGHQSAAGWQREQVTVADAGTVGPALALGLWQGQPLVAWRDQALQNVRVAHRTGDGWQVETLPPPAPLPGDSTSATSDVGRSLAMVVLPGGPAIAAYEATRGDLVLGVRGAETWSVARVAGVDPKTGADQGDIGSPVAAALGPGAELVLAYRDRSRDRVLVTRAKSGVISHQTVMDGARVDAVHQTQRSDLLGSVVSVAVLPTGMAVVAAQDASGMRVRVAAEEPSGAFVQYTVPGTLQAWPALVTAADGSVQCLWLDLDNPTRPGFGRLQHWTVPRGEP